MKDWKVRLLVEHKELKEKLVKLVAFLNSEEYYQLSDNNKLLLKDQKIAMELYLNVLNIMVFENIDNITVPDYGMLQGMASVFCNTWNAPSSSMKYLEEQLKKNEDKVATRSQQTEQEE